MLLWHCVYHAVSALCDPMLLPVLSGHDRELNMMHMIIPTMRLHHKQSVQRFDGWLIRQRWTLNTLPKFGMFFSSLLLFEIIQLVRNSFPFKHYLQRVSRVNYHTILQFQLEFFTQYSCSTFVWEYFLGTSSEAHSLPKTCPFLR